jgi:hypothetical protein
VAAANVGAQDAPDFQDRYHYSTIYYINLQDAKGKSMGNDVDEDCIHAYVGNELRGISTRWTTSAATGQRVLVVRVWGQSGDATKVKFRLYYGEKGKEIAYKLGEFPFNGGVEESYGSAAKPTDIKFVPIDEMVIVPSVVSVKLGETTTVTTKLMPENHTELDKNKVIVFKSSDETIFTVGQSDGVITGVKGGEAQLTSRMLYVADKSGTSETIEAFRTFTTVTVVTDDIPVTSIRNDMPTTQLQREIGRDFLLSFTVLPEYATNRKVHYEVGDESIVTYTTDSQGETTFRGVKTGRTTISVVSDFDAAVKLDYLVEIIYAAPDGHVVAITPKSKTIEALVGDIINSQLLYTIYPEDVIDKSVTFKVVNGKDGYVLDQNSTGSIVAEKAGQSTVRIISNENSNVTADITVNVYEPKEATTLTFPDELMLSKFNDVMAHLTLTPADATIDPTQITISVEESKNAGWGAVATVTATDKTGRNWYFGGRYTGDYTYTVKYKGNALKTNKGNLQGTLHIPAEYVLETGWQWVSIYATPSTGSISLKSNDKWADWLTSSTIYRLEEIRSCNAFMHYDWEYGYFGTLTDMRPDDGCLKISVFCDVREMTSLTLNIGSSNLKKGSAFSLPQAAKGYTWMTYPHELDHSLKTLGAYLKNSASEGDQIISINSFIEFNDGKWIGDDDFVFEAGQGYVYYNNGAQAKTIDWGPATLAPEAAASRVAHRRRTTAPDMMPIVIDPNFEMMNPEDYTVAAFVNGECRGIARQTADGLLHLSVAGCSGETVTLCLMHKFTGETKPTISVVEGKKSATLPFGTKAGNHRMPLTISSSFTDHIDDLSSQEGIYDLQGRKMNENVKKLGKGIYIVNGKKVIK